jgi:ubiquinone/menaquinone biosynthesis C-methylase UbiE
MDRDGLWARVGARLYDRMVAAGERAGMRERRARLLRDARGRVVEIGAGTGLNLAHYPDTIDELILTEPGESMGGRLHARLREAGVGIEVVRAEAESLPFADRSVDTVVSTIVLCTVRDPDQALREVARVLRPGGELLFIEHVRSDSERLAAWQDRLMRPWRRVAHGCHCNRRTVDMLRAHGFELLELRHERWRDAPVLVRPLAVGRARRPGIPSRGWARLLSYGCWQDDRREVHGESTRITLAGDRRTDRRPAGSSGRLGRHRARRRIG